MMNRKMKIADDNQNGKRPRRTKTKKRPSAADRASRGLL
jgi:hypothetical protein